MEYSRAAVRLYLFIFDKTEEPLSIKPPKKRSSLIDQEYKTSFFG